MKMALVENMFRIFSGAAGSGNQKKPTSLKRDEGFSARGTTLVAGPLGPATLQVNGLQPGLPTVSSEVHLPGALH